VLSYVGAGKGNYKASTSYTFVGDGAGAFDLVKVPTSCRCSVCCCASSGLGVVALLFILFAASSGPTTTTTSTTPQPKYDCEKGYFNWEEDWETDKKSWCCAHHGRGCLRPTTSTVSYYCHTKNVWSLPKAMWCCRHQGIGCPTTHPPITTPAPDPNCAVGTVGSWETSKRVWCCTNHHVGCPDKGAVGAQAPAPVGGQLYDCDAGLAANWPEGKKAWCCTNLGKGCSG